MSTANPLQTSAPATSRASSTSHGAGSHLHHDAALTNGHHHHHHHEGGGAPTHGGSANASKKSKPKSKATDPNEASKLIAAKISQLELDAAGEKDQEAEIGAWTNQLLTVEVSIRTE
jgi:hypothetical protein